MKINQSYLFGGMILALVISSLNSVFIIRNRPDSKEKELKELEERQLIDKDAYQAVFLSNNQIYFGHLTINSLNNYLKLLDVYYIKVNERDQKKNQLVRLGDTEPHGPNNEMIINKETVIFWENLKSDSPIVQGIETLILQNK